MDNRIGDRVVLIELDIFCNILIGIYLVLNVVCLLPISLERNMKDDDDFRMLLVMFIIFKQIDLFFLT